MTHTATTYNQPQLRIRTLSTCSPKMSASVLTLLHSRTNLAPALDLKHLQPSLVSDSFHFQQSHLLPLSAPITQTVINGRSRVSQTSSVSHHNHTSMNQVLTRMWTKRQSLQQTATKAYNSLIAAVHVPSKLTRRLQNGLQSGGGNIPRRPEEKLP